MKKFNLYDIESDMNYCSLFRTVACVGDSLSSGELVSKSKEGKNEFHDWFEYSWGQFIARRAGFKAYNFSRGGMTAKEYVESFADFNRMWSPEYAAQAYVIALGVNDLLGLKMEVGAVSDVELNGENKPTFAGYYAKIIQRYKEINPRAYFFLVTMPKQFDDCEHNKNMKAAHAALLKDFTKTFSNTYLIDLYNLSPEFDEEAVKKYMMNGHMTPAGYIFSAECIRKVWNEVIKENLNDFNDSAFVGTEMYSKR